MSRVLLFVLVVIIGCSSPDERPRMVERCIAEARCDGDAECVRLCEARPGRPERAARHEDVTDPAPSREIDAPTTASTPHLVMCRMPCKIPPSPFWTYVDWSDSVSAWSCEVAIQVACAHALDLCLQRGGMQDMGQPPAMFCDGKKYVGG